MGLPTKAEKRRFIRELIKAVEKDILSKVKAMPEDWDGIEIRRYIAGKFRECEMGDFAGRRKRAFESAVVNLNL